MGIIGLTAEQIGQALANPSSAGNTAVTSDELIPFINVVVFEFHTIDDVFAQADDRMAAAVTIAKDAGSQVTTIGLDLKQITDHTYQVVIPESMSWLRGEMILHIIDPMRAQIAHEQDEISFLDGWRGQIDNWRHNWVDPNIAAWRTFKHYFDGWPQSVLTVVRQWLQHPAVFAQFAVPAIAAPLVQYIAAAPSLPLRDELVQALLTAAPDRYRYAVAAFETILDQEWS